MIIKGEKLTESDLKQLDDKIKSIISKQRETDDLKRNLSKEPGERANTTNNLVLPEIEKLKQDNVSVRSHHSKMSGVSNISKLDNKKKAENQFIAGDMEERMSCYSGTRGEMTRMDFNKEGDEWNAIAQFNQKQFAKEKVLNKYKDKEIKKRTREELDTQVKEKLRKFNNESHKNQEYDHILLQHVDFLSKAEKEKLNEFKKKIMNEKENRDIQLKEEKIRKRDEKKKERQFDKELISRLVEEMEKEKRVNEMKKIADKEQLKKVLQENDLHKIKMKELAEKERLQDIKATEEYARILDKQEKDRENFFKNKEKKAMEFMSKMAQTVIKDMDDKMKREEEAIRRYQIEKENFEKEDETRRKRAIHDNKKDIKKFLDMQVEEKRRNLEFEKTLNFEQSKIWKIDGEKQKMQEDETNEKIKVMNKSNKDFLMRQIQDRKIKKNEKMSDSEYKLNREVLEKIKVEE